MCQIETTASILTVPRDVKVDMLNIQALAACRDLSSMSLWQKEGVLEVANKLVWFGSKFGYVEAKKLLSTGETVSKAIHHMDTCYTSTLWN